MALPTAFLSLSKSQGKSYATLYNNASLLSLFASNDLAKSVVATASPGYCKLLYRKQTANFEKNKHECDEGLLYLQEILRSYEEDGAENCFILELMSDRVALQTRVLATLLDEDASDDVRKLALRALEASIKVMESVIR